MNGTGRLSGSEWSVSPDEARSTLDAVSTLTDSAAWEPSRWAAAVVGVAFAPIITAAVWGRFWWFYAGLALWIGLLLLLRRRLFNPYVRVRPWQQLGKQVGRANWGTALWPLWIPLTMLVPSRPAGIGPIVGIVAGVYTCWATAKLGERR